jgi:hypothetical protein
MRALYNVYSKDVKNVKKLHTIIHKCEAWCRVVKYRKNIAIGIGFLLSPALAPLIVLPHSLGAYPEPKQPLLLLAPRDGEDHPLAAPMGRRTGAAGGWGGTGRPPTAPTASRGSSAPGRTRC